MKTGLVQESSSLLCVKVMYVLFVAAADKARAETKPKKPPLPPRPAKANGHEAPVCTFFVFFCCKKSQFVLNSLKRKY